MPGGAGREDYSPMPVGGSGASRGRQDREGSGYYDRPANRARLQNQQARINQMQSRGEGIFGRPAKQSFLSGIGKKFKDWAGNMRGGINPLTNEYYTQDEYEDNVQDRRDRASIDRLARTRDVGKYANDPEGWAASDLSGRLGGLEKQFGIDQPVDARGLFEQEQGGIGATNVAQDLGAPFSMEKENMLREMINNSYDRTVTSRRGDDDKIQRFSLADMGIQPNAANDFNTQVAENINYGTLPGATKRFTPQWPWGATKVNPAVKQFIKESPNPTRAQFVDALQAGTFGGATTGAFGENVDELFKGTDLDAGFFTTELGDVNPTFISPEGSFGGNIDINRSQLSKDALGSLPEGFWKGYNTGGRVGYNTGGRVGILSIF